MRFTRRLVALTLLAAGLAAVPDATAETSEVPATTPAAQPTTPAATTPPAIEDPLPGVADYATAARTAAAPGDVARALRRQQLFLTVAQTKSVQRRLHVAADGIWGSGTVDGARRYQRRHRLAITGSANVETLRRMGLKVARRFEARLWAARARARKTPASKQTPAAASVRAAEALRISRTAYGVPYRFGGTTTAGFDCSGLVQWAYRRAGVSLPRRSFEMYRKGFAITKGAIRPGDLVFFDAAGPGASHVGIVATKTTAISATSSSGVVEHDISTGYWALHYVGARRVAAR